MVSLLLTPALALAGVKHSTKSRAYQSPCLNVDNGTRQGLLQGYGNSSTLALAKQQAYKDIAEQISVHVRSQSQATTRKQGDKVEQSWNETVDAFSTTTLDNLLLICLDNKDPSGQLHVRLQYDARPLAMRIAEKLSYFTSSVKWQGSQALTQSQLVKNIDTQLMQYNIGAPTQLSLSLDFTAQGWQIYLGEQHFALPNSQLSYAINWPLLKKGNSQFVALTINNQPLPARVSNHSEYRWRVTPAKTGYFHLLGLYQDGSFGIVRQDIPITNTKTFNVPNDKGVLEAGVIAPNTITTDVYIALITSTPLQQTGIANLINTAQLGSNNSLTHFLEQMELLEAEIVPVALTVEP